jgi:hypothetical protein
VCVGKKRPKWLTVLKKTYPLSPSLMNKNKRIIVVIFLWGYLSYFSASAFSYTAYIKLLYFKIFFKNGNGAQ